MTGTPKEITDTACQIIWQADYKAWGEIDLYRVHQIDQPLRFQGQYADDETGFYYTTFRYYDPHAGRFTTQDPIGLAGGWNLYQYAPNPTGWTDPLGLSCASSQPEKVVNSLRSFNSKIFRVGNNIFKLDKSGMKHILERHHPNYWDGSVKKAQTFFDKSMSIDDIKNAIFSVLKQNRDILNQRGTIGMYQIKGEVNGIQYTLGLKNGRVGQFYRN